MPALRYQTHDNGGRPFTVEIDRDQVVKIYRNIYDEKTETIEMAPDPFLTYRPSKVWVGRSPFNRMTSFSGGHGPRFDGNSFLFQVGPRRYIFVGDRIFSFSASSPIVKFVSPVGNNDVPYPYAFDSRGWCYLMPEDVKVQVPPDQTDDPYDYYYESGVQNITDRRHQPFQGITRFFRNNRSQQLHYQEHPAETFDRWTKQGRYVLSVKKQDGTRVILDRPFFVKLMREYGKHAGISAIKAKMIQKRVI